MSAIEKFVCLYQELDSSSIRQLSEVYSPPICFVDPVTTYTGIDQVAGYFAQLLHNTKSCRCIITRSVNQREHHIERWEMCFSHSGLGNGKVIKADGLSEFTIEHNKVVYQRNFYDLSEMVYQHIPVLGWLINKIKKGLAK